MFTCPNCNTKISWKKSLNLKINTVVTCPSCKSALMATRASYYSATVVSLFFLLLIGYNIVAGEELFFKAVTIALGIIVIPFVFYSMVKFEKVGENFEKF